MSSISYKVVELFEKTIAEYAGSKYAVAVESCCMAIFLCCKYFQVKEATIPKRTYPGVACAIINAGGKVKFDNRKWEGNYFLWDTNIVDSALRFRKNMFNPGQHFCLSFHAKKILPIGRGGMILTNDLKFYKWLKKARFDGRGQMPLSEDSIDMVGWNAYMTPEQAARGLMLFDAIKYKYNHDLKVVEQNYPDLSKIDAYK